MTNISMFDYMYEDFKIDKTIRLIELFAGVGSQAMALRNLGADFEHHKVVEFDKYAIASYNAIHETNFETTDITKVKGEDLKIVDTDNFTYLLTYSFPCQDLSVAGKMQGMSKDSGTRSGLLWEVERLLNEVEDLPQILLMENVPQVISQQNITDFHLWQKFLENKGYMNYTETLNARDYGVAQNRNRTFMVSVLGEYSYKFPQPIPLRKTIEDYLETKVDEKYYVNEHFLGQIKNTKFRENDTHKDNTLAISNFKYKGFAVMDYRYDEGLRIRGNGLSPTLTTRGIQSISGVPLIYNHKTLRFITERECWRLMGFTDEDFHRAEQVNSNSQLYKQAGNSIVVEVLEGIFKQMF